MQESFRRRKDRLPAPNSATTVPHTASELEKMQGQVVKLSNAKKELEAQVADLCAHVARAEDERGRLQQESNRTEQVMRADLVSCANQSIQLASLRTGLLSCLVTLCVAFFARIDTGISVLSGVLLCVPSLIWTVLAFSAGYRARKIMESQRWVQDAANLSVEELRAQLVAVRRPGNLRNVMRSRKQLADS